MHFFYVLIYSELGCFSLFKRKIEGLLHNLMVKIHNKTLITFYVGISSALPFTLSLIHDNQIKRGDDRTI